MKKNYRLNTALFCGLFTLASTSQAAAFTFTTIDCANAFNAISNSINTAGQITGRCNDTAGNQGFLYNGTTSTPFDAGPSIGATNMFTNGMAINASGAVTGYFINGTSTQGFVYNNGVSNLFTIQDSLNAPTGYIVPRSINASGKVVGEYMDRIDATHGLYRGFIYDSVTNTYTTFDSAGTTYGNGTIPFAINDSGQITGLSNTLGGFIYNAGVVTQIVAPDGSNAYPATINNNGDVAGTYYDINNVQHGFVYSAGVVSTVDVPNATATDILTINDNGQTGGFYTDAAGVNHGFVKTGATITTVDYAGATETEVLSLNASGQAAGYYMDTTGFLHAYVTTPIGGAASVVLGVSAALPTATVGTAYTGSITASKGTAPYTVTVSGLPTGLISNNGVISGTPSTAGTYTLTSTVTDKVGNTGSATSVLTVNPAAVKLSVAPSLPAATVGQAYTGSVAVNNGTGPYTIVVSGLPAGLSNANGAITGTPSAAGTFALLISVSDSLGNLGSSTAALTVAAASSGTGGTPTSVAVANAGKSTITAVNGTSFTIATGGVITTNASTKIEWNRKNQVYLVGDKVEWQGKTVNGVFVATIVTLN